MNKTSEWNTCLQDFQKVAHKLKHKYKVNQPILDLYDQIPTTTDLGATLVSLIKEMSDAKHKLVTDAHDLDKHMVDLEKDRLSDQTVSTDDEYQIGLNNITSVNQLINYLERQIEKIAICSKYI